MNKITLLLLLPLLLVLSTNAISSPHKSITDALKNHPAQSYWFVFRKNPIKKNLPGPVKVLTFQALEINQCFETLTPLKKKDMNKLKSFLFNQNENANEPGGKLNLEKIIETLNNEYNIRLDPYLMELLKNNGPKVLAELLELLSKDNHSFHNRDSKIYPYIPMFTKISPIWFLGSLPPELNEGYTELKPLAPHLIKSISVYLYSFWYIFICIGLGVLLGMFQGYVLQWWARSFKFRAWCERSFQISYDSINALPRLLLIILFILLFREYAKPLELWMIAIPIGLSNIPIIATVVKEQLEDAIDNDMIALRRSQGFSHFSVLRELFRFRLLLIPLAELFTQFLVFIYFETLIQFMIQMSPESSMSGIAPPGTLGNILMQLSYELSFVDGQGYSSYFKYFTYWCPLIAITTFFALITLLTQSLKNMLTRSDL